MKTPVELCNDALRIMGLRPDCTNIDNEPISQSDKVFNAFYEQTRRKMIKLTRPRFACVENYELAGTPIDPTDPDSDKVFFKPLDCLYVQNVDDCDNFTEYGRQIVPYRTAKGLPSAILIIFTFCPAGFVTSTS